MKWLSGCLGVILLCAPASAQTLNGRIVAVHASSQNRYIPGVQPSSGVTVKDTQQIYRVETEDRFLELEGGRKLVLAVGASIVMRIDKHTAFVVVDGKEKKFRIVGEELKK